MQAAVHAGGHGRGVRTDHRLLDRPVWATRHVLHVQREVPLPVCRRVDRRALRHPRRTGRRRLRPQHRRHHRYHRLHADSAA